MKKLWLKTGLLLMLSAMFFAGCKNEKTTANLSVKLTDDPFPMSFVASVDINITKVEIKNADTDEYFTIFEGNATYNIADLTNGATAELSVTDLPAGTYDKVRITVNDVNITLTDGRSFDVTSGTSLQAESRIEPPLQVDNEGQASLLLDVDLAESLHFVHHAMTHFISNVADILNVEDFHLDFRAADLSQTGTIAGTVTDENGNVYANATVKLETHTDLNGDGEEDHITTISDANGTFVLLGVPEGSYLIKVEAEHGTHLISDNEVTVTAGETVTVNSFHTSH